MWPASGGRLRRVLERTCLEDQDATMRHPGRPGILHNAKPRTKPRHFATVRAGSLVVTTKGLPLRSYIFRIPAQQQFLQVSDKMSGVSEIILCWSFPGLVPFAQAPPCGDLPIGSRSSNIGLEASITRCTRSVNIEQVHYMSSFCSFRKSCWMFIEFKVDIIAAQSCFKLVKRRRELPSTS
jgi:hypothetical protein